MGQRICHWSGGIFSGKGKVTEEAFYYMSVYPNQNTFVLITAALIKLGNLLGVTAADRSLLFNLFNMACLDLSVFLTFPILKEK